MYATQEKLTPDHLMRQVLQELNGCTLLTTMHAIAMLTWHSRTDSPGHGHFCRTHACACSIVACKLMGLGTIDQYVWTVSCDSLS